MLLIGAILLAIFVVPAPWGLAVVAVAAVVEVAETAFWLWLSRRRTVQMGPETLVGQGQSLPEALKRRLSLDPRAAFVLVEFREVVDIERVQ